MLGKQESSSWVGLITGLPVLLQEAVLSGGGWEQEEHQEGKGDQAGKSSRKKKKKDKKLHTFCEICKLI